MCLPTGKKWNGYMLGKGLKEQFPVEKNGKYPNKERSMNFSAQKDADKYYLGRIVI